MLGAALYLAAAVLAAVQPSPAAPPSPAVAKADPEARQAALKLASVLYTPKSQTAAAERIVDTQIAPTFRANEDFQFLEREYPGFIDAVLKDMKPALVRFTLSVLPEYQNRVATLFASALSRADIEDITAFYLSSTGQKLIASTMANLSLEAMLAEASAEPDKPASYSAVAKDHQKTAREVVKSLDAQDKAALAELGKKPYAFQLTLLGASMRKLDQDFTNRPAPEFEKEVETIIKSTLERFKSTGQGRTADGE